MSITTDIVAIVGLGGLVWWGVSKLPDVSVAAAAAAVDQRDDHTTLGAVQNAVSSVVEKIETEIRARQDAKPVTVRQYSFDASKWGD